MLLFAILLDKALL